MILSAFITAFIFFVGLFFLTALTSALRRLHKRDSKKLFKILGNLFFYRPVFLLFFPKDEYEGILFSTLVSQNIARFIVLSSWSLWLYFIGFGTLSLIAMIFLVIVMIVLFYTLGDYVPRLIGNRFPARVVWFAGPIASPFLLLGFPLSFLFIKISQSFWKSLHLESLNEPLGELKQEIFDIIQSADLSSKLNPHDKKLIESVVRFQSRIAREVMVPRIDIFSLNASTTIEEAAKQLEEEGYSRVPVYKETIDEIIGVLMYKDILTKYMEYREKNNDTQILLAPIESIIKNVMYTPETKKISNLLQDFRKKQVHLAIVVDEYGGTEGIVTIEDILEEIVGEIEDEYDEEEDHYAQISDGSWIVDGRMSVLDVEEQLGVHLPQEGDYDTLGGFIFQKAGSIPTKGFKIKLDDAELEVVKSNDRRIEKVKIKRTLPPAENKE